MSNLQQKNTPLSNSLAVNTRDFHPLSICSPDLAHLQIYTNPHGVVFNADCLKVLPGIEASSVDTIFADPPFNLDKQYGSKVDDNLSEKEYVIWSKAWLKECIRILKPGGSLFVYNLPKWNITLGAYLLEEGMLFRHWIAVNIKLSLPIQGRLYPSHYSLLYYTKGKPKTFRKIRTPIKVCRHCSKELKDYGGHRDAMNPNGVNLADVWDDIPPVRHRKFKSEKRTENQLSTKLVNRVVQMSTQEGDIVLDPFGGSGTTYDVCERSNRYWIGIEKESCDAIVERLSTVHICPHVYDDFIQG